MENRTIAHSAATDKLVACPYSDYRAGTKKPINAAALVAFNRLGPQTLDLISHHAARVRASRRISEPDVLQLWRISKLAVSSVARLGIRDVLRPTNVPRVKPSAAAVYKVARGLVSLFEELTNAQGPLESCRVELILNFVEQRQLLEGPREVCAAPTALIRRVLTHLLSASIADTDTTVETAADVKYTALLSMAERVCFACQLVRSSLHSPRSLELPVRHTFASARDAAQIGRGDPGLAMQALEFLLQLHWDEINPEGERAIHELVAAGRSILQLAASRKPSAWDQFKHLAVRALEQVNQEVAELESSSDVRVLTQKDFDLFFGPTSVTA